MKKIMFLVSLAFGTMVFSQNVNIPDPVFKAKLLSANPSVSIAENASQQKITVDTNNDGEIQQSEADAVAYLWIDDDNLNLINIQSLEGIKSFTNLKGLFVCV